MKLGLLVGNSSLRVALLDGGEIREARRLEWSDLVESHFRGMLEVLQHTAVDEVVVGSVRDDLLEELLAATRDRLPAVRLAGRDFAIPVENRYQKPEQAGVDRLLNAVAAHALWPESNVVVLDFGTALSITVVSAAGEFLGGVIGAGAGVTEAALHRETPSLPVVRLRPQEGFLHRNTEDAVRAGIFWQLVGGAQLILDGLKGELSSPVRSVATGGEADLVVHAMKGLDRLDPDLTMRGLCIASEPECSGR